MRIFSSAIILFFLCIVSCVSDKEEGVLVSDATLFNLSQSVSSFVYYKNSQDTLVTDVNSEHISRIRVRFNPKASQAMNSDLSGLSASSFPDESMIVKEVYDHDGGPLEHIVIMYKLHGAANSESGWVWGKMKPDGEVIYPSSQKGGMCVGCHSQGTNADLVRTFDLH